MRTVLVLYILISFVKLIDGTFQCVTEGMFANPNDPSSFYHCAHGIAYLKHCPPTLVWYDPGQYCDRQVVVPTIAITISPSTTEEIPIATATPSLLPPQCQGYTSITDGTRHVDNRNPGSDSDRLYFSSTPTWVRFEGAAGTRLADYSVPTGHCGAEATGWVKSANEPTVGETEDQTVCFNWSGMSCIWPQKIPMTNCQDFFVYALVAPSLSDVVRYCTI